MDERQDTERAITEKDHDQRRDTARYDEKMLGWTGTAGSVEEWKSREVNEIPFLILLTTNK